MQENNESSDHNTNQLVQDESNQHSKQQNKETGNMTIHKYNSSDIESIKKQESFELYMDLTSPEHIKQIKKATQRQKSNLHSELPQLIQVQDSTQITSLILQPSPKSQKPLKIQIVGYRNQTFMKVATQIFDIKISNPNKNPIKAYAIQRRFSDFVDLYEQLFYNQPGYILLPFPQKTLESFLKLKLGIAVEPIHKSQLVQKRISQLEQFANWISGHRQLRNSEEFLIFITEDPKLFQQGKNRLNQCVEQHKGLEVGSHFQNIVDIGKSMLSSYFKSSKNQEKVQRKKSEQVQKIMSLAQSYIKDKKQDCIKTISRGQSLLKAQKSFSEFIIIDTQNDLINKICAKHDSSRQFYKKYSFFLEFIFLQKLNFQLRKIEEAEKVLIHRKQILEIIKTSNGNQNDRKAKLQRILQRFQKNFEANWPNFQVQNEDKIDELLKKFQVECHAFKIQMQKIWKFEK